MAERLLLAQSGIETLVHDGDAAGVMVVKRSPESAFSPSFRLRLEHAAEALRGGTRGLAPPLRVHARAGELRVERAFVDGEPLAERLARGPLQLHDGLLVARAAFRALAWAHDRGVLHGGISPSNVILASDGAVLVDFGFTRASRADAAAERARYLAPEQAGLLDAPSDEKSDLYAMGLVLYEALCGKRAFAGDTVRELLRQQLSTRPAELRGLGVAVPRVVDELLQRLLRKDPRDRYQTAEAVVTDVEAILAALRAGDQDPSPVLGLHDRRRTLAEPAFVVRTKELGALDAALDDAIRGQGGLILLEAESGGGKTRLLDELAMRAQPRGVRVLRGQGVDQAAALPFQVLAGVAEQTLDDLKADPIFAARFDAALGDERVAATEALPILAQAFPARAETLGPEAHGEQRSVQALSAFLDALGGAERPALVILDDCQWADELTFRLLGRWMREREEKGAGHVAVVAAFRTEEVGVEHALRRVAPKLHVRLAPFQHDDVRRLVESMAGSLPEEAVDAVARLADGSPFMASAVLRGLVESGALMPDPSGWRIDASAMADMRSSRESATFLGKRLRLLPQDTLHVLSVAAVLGKEFDLAEACELAGLRPSIAIPALEAARRRHIVWQRGEVGRYAFVHDKLRETLLAMMAPELKRDLHHAAASRLEGERERRVFELAYHYDSAGEPQKALPYALAAAEESRKHHALALAEQHYRIAQRGASQMDARTRQRIAEGLGDVLMLRGAYDAAAAELEVARALAEAPLERAQIETKAGELAFKRGDVKASAALLEGALRTMGRYVPRSTLTFVLLAAYEGIVQVLHSLFPKLFLGRKKLATAGDELVAIRLYSRLAYTYWFGKGLVACGWAHLREMNLIERYETSPELAQAYSEHAPVMTMIPWTARGERYVRRSLEIRRDLGDIWGQGQSNSFYGVVLYSGGRYQDALVKLQDAIRLLERTGDQWEVNTAGWHVALCHYRLGDLPEAIRAARRVNAAGLEIGDHQAAGISLGVWAKASAGQAPPELIAAALARGTDDVHTYAEIRTASALGALRAGRPGEAVAMLEEARALIRSRGLRQEYVAPVLPWLATALREAALASPPWDPRKRDALIARANRAARASVRLAKFYQNNLPHALRERALAAALRGRSLAARRDLDASLRVATAQGALWERAQTLQAMERLAGAESEAAPLGSISLADRIDALVDAGRTLVTSNTPTGVFEGAREAGLAVLRGESAVLVMAGETRGPEGALAARAMASGKPARLTSEGPEELLAAGVKSAIAIPIQARGRSAACVVITHREVEGVYGEDEERLAEFLGSLAGAALENAEGYEELTQAHVRLQFQKGLLERQGEAAIDGILVVGADGRILSRNRRFLEMWGLPESVGEGALDAEALRDALPLIMDPERFIERVRWLYQHPEEESRDEVLLADGRTLDRYSAPVVTVAGHARVWFFRDITRHKQAEIRLREMNEQLVELGRMKTMLLNTASHELNTPLTPVKVQIHLMRSGALGALTPAQGKAMGVLERNVSRLATLVQDLLDVSRLEGGRLKMDLAEHRLDAIVREEGESYAQAAQEAGVRLKVDATTTLPVSADAKRVAQVLDNLMNNALKFTRPGGSIHVSATQEGEDAVVLVRDDGAGLTREQRDRLFQPFSQVHDTMQQTRAGSGLGLYICKGIVEALGGAIWADSEGPGRGSTFAFRLPLRR